MLEFFSIFDHYLDISHGLNQPKIENSKIPPAKMFNMTFTKIWQEEFLNFQFLANLVHGKCAKNRQKFSKMLKFHPFGPRKSR